MAETFVLVHGAWHGGWCWAAVINQLERLGDRAYAVDLPGHGMNRADRTKVTLDSYVNSVAEFIERHDLKNVVLAGHSLGGITIPGVAAKDSLADQTRGVGHGDGGARRAAGYRSGDVAVRGGGRFVAGAIEYNRDARQGRYRRAYQRHGACACGIRGVGARSAAVRAPARASADGALLRHRYSEQLSRLRRRPDAVAGAPNWHPHFSSRLRNPTLKFVKSGHEVMFTHPVECARALHELASGD